LGNDAFEHHLGSLEKKATPNAPNGYTPQTVDCPSTRPSIRQAAELSPEETSWLPQRRNKTISPMQDLLSRLDITDFDVDSFMRTAENNATLLPNIGLAFSGGGYRALMNGAGALAAFDSRTSGSSAKGHLGGLLQASTYIAGLSGGSWLVGSIYANNFTSVENILELGDDEDAIWQFDEAITKGPSHGILDAASYVKSIAREVADKKAAGFNTSLTDAWGRALSYQLVNNVDGGPAYTFSSIAQDATFKSGGSPMPIFVTDGRNPDELVIDGNATVYEINPWELGTFDPTTFAFAPLEYLGSDFSDGKVSAEGTCVRGFDNMGYIMGTSSSLFNQGLLQAQGTEGKLAGLLTSFLQDVDEQGSKFS
jgi:lysophospholipase